MNGTACREGLVVLADKFTYGSYMPDSPAMKPWVRRAQLFISKGAFVEDQTENENKGKDGKGIM